VTTAPATRPRIPVLGHYLDMFRRYADFRGRATRTRYWLAVLVHFVISVALLALVAPRAEQLWFVLVLYYLAGLVPVTALVTRRLHDAGHSGLLQLIGLVPFGFLAVLVLTALPGTRGPNQHGPDPRDPAVTVW
jgi:uncharacterized membrane protein YhaH (DUF805 family)